MIMKNIFKYIFVGGIAVVLAASCDLDLSPRSSIAYKEGSVIFTSETDVKAFDNGLHSSFRSLCGGTYSQLPELVCDGFNATLNYNNHYGGEHQMNENFNASSSYVETIWGGHYVAIKNYNIVIENADNVSDALRADARLVKGHAYFYRACSYLTLARCFGPAYNKATAATDACVPLVLVYNQLEKPARASVQSVYDAVKADLDSAFAILKGVPGKISSQVPTVDAVYAEYARYYLDVADYVNAAACADSVINSSAKYAVSSTAEAMAAEYTNDAGTEAIMQMYASQTEGSVSNTMYLGEGGMRSDETGVSYASYYIPTKDLIDEYNASDLRLKTWFDKAKYPFYCRGGYYSNSVYAFCKYPGDPNLYTGTFSTGAQARKPFLIGEQYLIAAEAYFQVGSTDNAKSRLQTLQSLRASNVSTATLDNIKTEWRKETVGEGLRLSCLKRWGDGTQPRTPQTDAASNSLVQTGAGFDQRLVSADDYHFCWPIPSYELKVNPNLQQNSGYSATED